MPNPVNTPHTPIVVEYDANGSRDGRTFADPFQARRFYVAKHKAGKNPAVRKAAESETISDNPRF